MSEIKVEKGEVIKIGETETFGQNGFRKRLIVIRTDEQYPQELPFEFVQDKVSILDKYSVGDNVAINYNLRGQEYKEKWYASLGGWRIVKAESGSTEPKDPLA